MLLNIHNYMKLYYILNIVVIGKVIRNIQVVKRIIVLNLMTLMVIKQMNLLHLTIMTKIIPIVVNGYRLRQSKFPLRHDSEQYPTREHRKGHNMNGLQMNWIMKKTHIA